MRDRVFWVDYVRHVGNSLGCCCNFEGADRTCDKGWALWALVHQGRKKVS